MRIISNIYFKKSPINKSVCLLKKIIENNYVWRPTEDVQYIFLCGANIKGQNKPSKRRENLIDFASKNLPYAKLFLAETIFGILEKEGHTTNILDVENEISKVADHIVIVLESESAFCELGAFASSSLLRNKLIVINDSQYKKSTSFINTGPIKAIEEIKSKDLKVLYYRMNEDGIYHGDGIGDIYNDLFKLLFKKPKIKRTRVEECDPSIYFTKDSLRFIHDLIYFSGPIYSSELAILVEHLFGKVNRNRLNNHIAMLCAINEIKQTSKKAYKSNVNKHYFEYDKFDDFGILASFKCLYMRYDYERLL